MRFTKKQVQDQRERAVDRFFLGCKVFFTAGLVVGFGLGLGAAYLASMYYVVHR